MPPRCFVHNLTVGNRLLPFPAAMNRRSTFLGLIVATTLASATLTGFAAETNLKYAARPPGTLTFTKDIAAIADRRCALCHRPGQPGPFPLLTAGDFKKHGPEIIKVTARRYMPPWLPETGYGEFVGERRLTDDEIGVLKQWLDEGEVAGRPEDRPPAPQWTAGWQLGKPDLVVTLPQPYTLPADGRDVYRNFVAPIPLAQTRFVRAVEFQPGAGRGVHHTFIRFDRTRQSRRLDEKDPEPGFPGMDNPPSAFGPPTQFLSWQIGRIATTGGTESSWALETNSDMVLQVHMQTTGKPELIQPSVGFYFTDQPPAQNFMKIELSSMDIDIPAGETNHLVQDDYVLPVDAEVIGVLPHAHYLGKDLQGFATLPDGRKQWLIWIKDWDFNWQGDYHYVRPLALPKGTRLSLRYTYDNSAGNPRNPHHPPVRVRYGVQTTDEMAELWLLVRVPNAPDFAILSRDYRVKMVKQNITYYEYRLRLDPNDAKAICRLGQQLLVLGQRAEALVKFRRAVELDGNDDEGHYFLGLVLRMNQDLPGAQAEFTDAIRMNPENAKAHGNLALVLLSLNQPQEAVPHFEEAIRLNPEDVLAHYHLGLLHFQRRELDRAEQHFRQAVRFAPENAEYRNQLDRVLRAKGASPKSN